MSDKFVELSALLDALGERVICAADGRICYMNAAARAAMGDLTGKSLSEALPSGALSLSAGETAACELRGRSCAVSLREIMGLAAYIIRPLEPAGSDPQLMNELSDTVSLIREQLRMLEDGVTPTESAVRRLRLLNYRLWRRTVLRLADDSAARGDLHVTRRSFDLSLCVSELCQTLEFFLRGRAVTLRCSCPGELTILGDRGLIELMLLNLVVNSLMHLGEDGLISITLRKRGEIAELVVDDNGTGMDGAALSAAFSGAGDGLRVASAVCQSHGGALVLSSGEGRGTRVAASLALGGGDMSFEAADGSYERSMDAVIAQLSPWLRPEDCDGRLLD